MDQFKQLTEFIVLASLANVAHSNSLSNIEWLVSRYAPVVLEVHDLFLLTHS